MEKKTFHSLGISNRLLKHMESIGFVNPTPIQEQAIPSGIEGRDIVGIAETGTGKTLAFLIPMLENIAKTQGQGLVLVPTRELATQVADELNKLGRSLNIVTATILGGASMHHQIKQLRRNPHVIIATPGRLIDHLEQRTLQLNTVSCLVLDEADRMMDMGFLPQIKKVLEKVPEDRQTLLFSATMPAEMRNIIKTYLRDPLTVEVARAGKPGENIEQRLYMIEQDHKIRLLDFYLTSEQGSALVFTRTKHGASKLCKRLNQMGYRSDELHSNRTQNQRTRVMEAFRRGNCRVLVATDIAARGLDVNDIKLVVNYDLPDQAEDYIHRIGRTGRAGKKGIAVSFATRRQQRDIRDISRMMKQPLPVKQLPSLPAARVDRDAMREFSKSESRSGGRDSRRSSYGRRDDERSGRDNRRSNSRDGRKPFYGKRDDERSGARSGGRPTYGRRDDERSSQGERPHAKRSNGGFKGRKGPQKAFAGGAGKFGGQNAPGGRRNRSNRRSR